MVKMRQSNNFLILLLVISILFVIVSCVVIVDDLSEVEEFDIILNALSLDRDSDGIVDYNMSSDNDNVYFSLENQEIIFFYDTTSFNTRTVFIGNELATINPIFDITYRGTQYVISATDGKSTDNLLYINPDSLSDFTSIDQRDYQIYSYDSKSSFTVFIQKRPLVFSNKVNTGNVTVRVGHHTSPYSILISFLSDDTTDITQASLLDYVEVAGYRETIVLKTTNANGIQIDKTTGFDNGIESKVILSYEDISTDYNVTLFRMRALSDSIQSGQQIPDTYATTSPHIGWTGAPSNTVRFVVILYDTESPTSYHWLRYNIHDSETNIPEGSPSGDFRTDVQGQTPTQYVGIDTSTSGTQIYRLVVFALGIYTDEFSNVSLDSLDNTGQVLFETLVRADKYDYSTFTYSNTRYEIKGKAIIEASYTSGLDQPTTSTTGSTFTTIQ